MGKNKYIMMVALLAMVSVAPVFSGPKKERKAYVQQLIGEIARGEAAMKMDVPAFLLDDMEAIFSARAMSSTPRTLRV